MAGGDLRALSGRMLLTNLGRLWPLWLEDFYPRTCALHFGSGHRPKTLKHLVERSDNGRGGSWAGGPKVNLGRPTDSMSFSLQAVRPSCIECMAGSHYSGLIRTGNGF